MSFMDTIGRLLGGKRFEPTKVKAEQMLDDKQLELGIKLFRNGIHDLKRMAGSSWGSIPRVHCPVPFGGWGFVEGRTEGFKVNRRLWLTEADDDMDFTEACVIVEKIPCLILEERWGQLTVTMIAGQDYLQEVFNPSGLPCCNVEDFKKLAPPVQKILHDVFVKVLEEQKKRPGGLSPDAIETMLRY